MLNYEAKPRTRRLDRYPKAKSSWIPSDLIFNLPLQQWYRPQMWGEPGCDEKL